MTWLTLLLLTAATARITRLGVYDSITSRLRFEIFKRFPPKTTTRNGKTVKAKFLGELVDCQWCFGVWVAGGLVAVTAQITSIPLPLLVWPAVAELASIVTANLDRG